jgi:HD-GYP domain-containing protein (c-di-GMP phosphodiesterase class II)
MPVEAVSKKSAKDEDRGSGIDSLDGPISELIKRYQVLVKDLDFGMFVAELDRPWLDTPFLLQGFMLESQVELDTIAKFCEYVFVDFELSKPEVSEAILKADMQNSHDMEVIVLDSHPQPFNVSAEDDDENKPKAEDRFARKRAERVFKARSDLNVTSATRERFKSIVRGSAYGVTAAKQKQSAFAKLFSWLRKSPEQEPLTDKRDRRKESLKGMIDPNLKLRNYRDKVQIEVEMPRARETFKRSEEVMSNFMSDVRSGKPAQIKQVQGAVIDMVDSMIDNPDALIWIARLRDEDVRTYNHGVKVALYLVAFGRHLGFPKEDLAYLGMIGMLADVGKSKLPRALIEKPGMLSPSEFALMKEHVTIGLHALKKTMQLPTSVELGIAQHHERLDGSGYPLGLKGDQISIYGRMTAIADCFAALITPRTYANPAAPQEALMNMFQWAGTAFHEPLIEQFVQAIGVFPIGSLVELSTGEVAVVLAHSRVKRLEPKVLVLTNVDKNPLSKPIELDLHKRVKDESAKVTRIVRGLPAGAYGLKLRDYYMSDVAKVNGLA